MIILPYFADNLMEFIPCEQVGDEHVLNDTVGNRKEGCVALECRSVRGTGTNFDLRVQLCGRKGM